MQHESDKDTFEFIQKESGYSQSVQRTANITLSIFNSPSASSPLVAVNIERTGDRHWHDETPFLNAFDEIIETIEDDLWSKVRRYFK